MGNSSKMILILLLAAAISLSMLGCFGRNTRKSYTYYNLGNTAMAEGKLIDAQNYFTKAHDLKPNDPDVEQMLGLTIFARGDFDSTGEYLKKAETHLLKAIEEYKHFTPPEDQQSARLTASEARVNLSAVYLEMGRFDDAIKQAQTAIADPLYRYPDRANYNIGSAYFQKQMAQKAVPYLKMSVQQNRNFAGGYKTLGEVYLNLKRYPDAVSSFKQAVQIFPKYSEAYYLLGVAYQKQNQRGEAQKTFRRCKEIDPEGTFGQKCSAFVH